MTVFRIIPHSAVLNKQSHKLWRALHGIYSGSFDRFGMKGVKLCYRIKERIWIDITLCSREEQDEKGNPIYTKETG